MTNVYFAIRQPVLSPGLDGGQSSLSRPPAEARWASEVLQRAAHALRPRSGVARLYGGPRQRCQPKSWQCRRQVMHHQSVIGARAPGRVQSLMTECRLYDAALPAFILAARGQAQMSPERLTGRRRRRSQSAYPVIFARAPCRAPRRSSGGSSGRRGRRYW